MVDLKTKIRDIPPKERIELLKKIRDLEEQKLQAIEQEKKAEFEKIKKQTQDLEDSLGQDIKETIEELTAQESQKFRQEKNKDVEEIIMQQKAPKNFDYNNLTDKLLSNKTEDQSQAYQQIKEIVENAGKSPEEAGINYDSLSKIKTVVDKMKEEDDSFNYKKRSQAIIDQAFNNIKKYEGF